MQTILLFILGACLTSTSFGLLFGTKAFPPWDNLSVTWGKLSGFNGLPENEQEAIKDGWTLSKDACKDTTFFKGKRYVLKGDISTMLLFDSNGHIAGMQLGVSNTAELFQKNQLGKTIQDDGTNFIITAYFTDPNDICSGKQRKTDVVGDKLIFLLDGSGKTMEIPLREKDITGTKWVKGKCFWSMGQHYWYKISNDMSCADTFPFFLLYNGNVLNGFGFATQFHIQSPRVEYPPQKKLWLFMEPASLPKCLVTSKYLSTQHVFLQRLARLNHC